MGSKCILQVCARRIQIVLLYYHTFTPTGQSPLLLSCSKQTTKKYNKNIKNSSAENITVTIRGVLGVGVFAVQQKIILIIMHKKYTMIICRFHGSWYYLKIKMHEKVLFKSIEPILTRSISCQSLYFYVFLLCFEDIPH